MDTDEVKEEVEIIESQQFIDDNEEIKDIDAEGEDEIIDFDDFMKPTAPETLNTNSMYPLLSQLKPSDINSRMLYFKNVRHTVENEPSELSNLIDEKITLLSSSEDGNRTQDDFEIFTTILERVINTTDKEHTLASHFIGLAYKWLIQCYLSPSSFGFQNDLKDDTKVQTLASSHLAISELKEYHEQIDNYIDLELYDVALKFIEKELESPYGYPHPEINRLKAMYAKCWIMHYHTTEDRTDHHFESVVKEYTDLMETSTDCLDYGWVIWVLLINSHFALSDLYRSPEVYKYSSDLANPETSKQHFETAKGMLDSFEDHYDAIKAAWIFYEVGIFKNGGTISPFTDPTRHRVKGVNPTEDDYKLAAELFDRAAEYSEEEGTPKEFWCLVHRAWAFEQMENNNYSYRHAVCEYLCALELYDETLKTVYITDILSNFAKLLLVPEELGYDLNDCKETEEYKAGHELLAKFKNGVLTSIPEACSIISRIESN